MPKKKTFREAIRFYLIDSKTSLGKWLDMFILFLNLVICGVLVAETYQLPTAVIQLLYPLEITIIALFVVEYIARLYGARNRIKHVFGVYAIIDLLSIIPIIVLFLPHTAAFMQIIKIFRVFRVFRIFRFIRFMETRDFFFGTISKHLLILGRLIVTILTIFFVGAALFYYAEHEINATVNNFGDAFYYIVVTLATVGFGDITPSGLWGRAVTVLMIISGIVLIPWQAGQIIKEWALAREKSDTTCKKCSLRYHDKDALHCKSCGAVIYQPHQEI
ncbi:ion transporter [archaeon]